MSDTRACLRLERLKQPPLCTTWMGVLHGAADFHGLAWDVPNVFGLSGHAFLINIHERLCPSGPYCWRREATMPLVENLGLRPRALGSLDHHAGRQERETVERALCDALDRGLPCALLNLEHQLITGYNATGLFLAQPWSPPSAVTPSRLSFGTWEELGQEFHADFQIIERQDPAQERAAILASLAYAGDLWTHPERHNLSSYGVGPCAYDLWIKAAPAEGSSHGAWWNAAVWSECRRMAADFIQSWGSAQRRLAGLCQAASDEYRRIADLLERAGDRSADPGGKVALLREARVREAGTVDMLAQLAAVLRQED